MAILKAIIDKDGRARMEPLVKALYNLLQALCNLLQVSSGITFLQSQNNFGQDIDIDTLNSKRQSFKAGIVGIKKIP